MNHYQPGTVHTHAERLVPAAAGDPQLFHWVADDDLCALALFKCREIWVLPEFSKRLHIIRERLQTGA